MKHQEKKYRVDSFEDIEKRLKGAVAEPGKTTTSTHYYGEHADSGVVKLVTYDDRDEIHILDEAEGKFSLRENIPVENKEAGLRRLKDKGYNSVSVVKMTHADYDYKSGLVGLYLINDFLHSVILNFPEGQHARVEQELGLDTAEVIKTPYNKYLEELGHLHLIKLG